MSKFLRRHIRFHADGKPVTAIVGKSSIVFRPYRRRKTTQLSLTDAYLVSQGQSLLALPPAT